MSIKQYIESKPFLSFLFKAQKGGVIEPKRPNYKDMELVWQKVHQDIIESGVDGLFKPQTKYGKDYLKG